MMKMGYPPVNVHTHIVLQCLVLFNYKNRERGEEGRESKSKRGRGERESLHPDQFPAGVGEKLGQYFPEGRVVNDVAMCQEHRPH